MHLHIFSGYLNRMQNKYTVRFATFVIKNSKFSLDICLHILTFLIIRSYAKYLVHILKVFRKIMYRGEYFS